MTFGPRDPASIARSLQPHWVYELIGHDGEPLYIGCSYNPGSRIAQWRSADWWKDIARVEINVFPNQRAALDVERELIERFEPVHNTVHTSRFNAGGWDTRRRNEQPGGYRHPETQAEALLAEPSTDLRPIPQGRRAS